MNVQGANLLSFLSGSESLGNLQQGLLGSSEAQAGFASAFLEQLGLLQSGLDASATSPDLTAIQDWVNSAKAGETQLDLQSFATFFGKDLPSAKRAGQDIDLEDTLQTLAGVLQQLEQLENGSDTQMLASSSLGVDGKIDDAKQSSSDDDLSDITGVAAGMLASSSLGVDGKIDDTKQSSSDDDLSDITGVAAGMPISVSQAELNETPEQGDENSEPTSILSAAQKNSVSLKLDSVAQNVSMDAAVNVEDFGTDFSRSISAMLARQGADGKPQQDKQNLNLKAEGLLSGLESQSDGEAGKTLPGVAADIAKLNQAMRANTSPVPAQTEMTKHYNDPAWNKELGEKLIWMHKQSIPSVELRLNPEHLGPVLVKIDVSHDQANIAFTAQHLAVKEALEAAIPKLREMLGGQQLNLVDVNVSQQQSDQRQQPREFFQMASDQGRNHSSEPGMNGDGQQNEAQNLVDEIETGRALASNGLLSLFA